jgi:chromosome partitioning protein
MAKTFCLINQKGGCGKSSTCFHLAGAFAADGLSVLLVDMDPQGSLSQGLLGSSVVEDLPIHATVASLFAESSFFRSQAQIEWATPVERVSLCPANQTLAQFNTPSPENGGMFQQTIRQFLDGRVGFDIVLIDCPPNLYRCSWTALIAADYVIIPVPPEDFGTQGLRVVHQAIDEAKNLNPDLCLLGHLITRQDRRLLVHQTYERRLRELHGDSVLKTVIPEASAFKVALACRQPVEFYAWKSAAADLTRRLSREILDLTDEKQARRKTA